MGQKTVRFSDLSGELITTDDTLARIVVHEHPELGGSPVEVEALSDEAMGIGKAALRVAVVDLHLPGEDAPRRVTMDAEAFDQLATDRPMSELLRTARPARRSGKTSRPTRAAGNGAGNGAGNAAGGGGQAARRDYATLEHAGEPHQGRITDTEKRLVREHFDEINDRLAAGGFRTISLQDSAHVERYGLAGLAAAAEATLG